MLQIKPAVSFSNEYLDKVCSSLSNGVQQSPIDQQINTKSFLTKYDQMEPFFELYGRLRKLTGEDLDSLEIVDLMEDLIVKKNLTGFSDLNFVRTLNDLRLCALDDDIVVESKVIKARDFLVKLRYLFQFYRLLQVGFDQQQPAVCLEQSAYLQREFFSLFPKLRDSFHFLLTCDLELLDKLNLDDAADYEQLHRKLSPQQQQRESTESAGNERSFGQPSLVGAESYNSSSCSKDSSESEQEEDKPANRIKLNELDKVLVNEEWYRKLYVVRAAAAGSSPPPNGQREELIIGEINIRGPEEKAANSFISANFEGKHQVQMLLSMRSTINVINAYTFIKLTVGGLQARQCLVDLAINSTELGLQHAYVVALDAHFGFTKVKMNFFYFDELDVPIEQNLVGNSFIEHIQTLSPCNYFTLKEEPNVKHHFLAESA